MNYIIKKSVSLLLALVMLFTVSAVCVNAEDSVPGPEADTGQSAETDLEDAEYPDGTRSTFRYFIAAYSDGDLLTYTSLGSSPTETRYSDGNGNNHINQKWDWSDDGTGRYTIYAQGGEHPYALTVNPTTRAVTVEPYDGSNVCQKWGKHVLGNGTVYITSRAVGASVDGYKLVISGSSVYVSNTTYTRLFLVSYDTYVASTSISYSNFYLAPESTKTVYPVNQNGTNIPTGAIKITPSNSKVTVSYNVVTGKTSGTVTLTLKDKLTNVTGTCTVNVTLIANGTYYLKNKQNSCYARVKNGSMADGTNAVQYALDGTNYEKWYFSLNQTTGYYTIKSKGSNTSYYLTVKNSASTLDQQIVLGTSSTANGA